MHGSLSPFDMHNTCIAAGPDFRKGILDNMATGNIDIAPTVLWLLGVEPQPKLSGRVLSEALAQPTSTRAALRDAVPGSQLPRERIDVAPVPEGHRGQWSSLFR